MHRYSHTSEVKTSEQLQSTEVYEQRAEDPYLGISKYLRGGMKILSNECGVMSLKEGRERIPLLQRNIEPKEVSNEEAPGQHQNQPILLQIRIKYLVLGRVNILVN